MDNISEDQLNLLRLAIKKLATENERLRKALESIRDSEVRTNGGTNLTVYINEILKLEQII